MLSILPRLTRKRPLMSIYLWKASALFSKNTFYDKASGSALFLISSQFSTRFQARVLIKSADYHVASSIYIRIESRTLLKT